MARHSGSQTFRSGRLEQAKKLVAAGKFNEAFDCYGFLRHEYPKCVALDDAVADFLYAEAGDWQRTKYESSARLCCTRCTSDSRNGRGSKKRWRVPLANCWKNTWPKRLFLGRSWGPPRLKNFPQAQLPRALNAVKLGRPPESRHGRSRGARRRQTHRAWRWPVMRWPSGPRPTARRQPAEEAFNAFPHVVVAVHQSLFAEQLTEPITDWSVRRTQRIRGRVCSSSPAMKPMAANTSVPWEAGKLPTSASAWPSASRRASPGFAMRNCRATTSDATIA